VVRRPAPAPRPAAPAPAEQPAHTDQPVHTDQLDTGAYAPLVVDRDTSTEAGGGAYGAAAVSGPQPTVSHQAFWALSPVERDVVDPNGVALFRIGPGAWALVIEDRGDSFLVRHEDGTVGILTDVSGVTRG
jgi:hypothetical protein